ncbi:m34.2 protein [Murid betaherpesvirus 1]|uniref:M34.2 protein n=2 Tax=Murid herpesvirus 1 TaxID=10366 RepID=H2A2N1_MUHV1|nr:m34.2 [Muromegalovirus WP15B]CCE57201.1 m34.2 protein [Murid betaherpesvirus 1]
MDGLNNVDTIPISFWAQRPYRDVFIRCKHTHEKIPVSPMLQNDTVLVRETASRTPCLDRSPRPAPPLEQDVDALRVFLGGCRRRRGAGWRRPSDVDGDEVFRRASVYLVR